MSAFGRSARAFQLRLYTHRFISHDIYIAATKLLRYERDTGQTQNLEYIERPSKKERPSLRKSLAKSNICDSDECELAFST